MIIFDKKSAIEIGVNYLREGELFRITDANSTVNDTLILLTRKNRLKSLITKQEQNILAIQYGKTNQIAQAYYVSIDNICSAIWPSFVQALDANGDVTRW